VKTAGTPGSRDEATTIVQEALRSPGHSLDPSTRALMEPRFGRDFGQVRVHADAAAARSAKELRASAFTAGRDIFFAAGRFAPQSLESQHLLAHELTHVVQQDGKAQLVRRAPANYPSNTKPAQTGPKSASEAAPRISADDWIWTLETLRRQLPEDFVKLLAQHEGLFYPILQRYGFKGPGQRIILTSTTLTRPYGSGEKRRPTVGSLRLLLKPRRRRGRSLARRDSTKTRKTS
jgi:Domain of unknown function (DUF4157)